MILGSSRVPFQRPAAASGSFVPGLPQTVMNTHFHPLTMVTNPMPAASQWRPGLPPQMGPTALPAVPAVAPAAPAVAPPAAGGMSGFGSTGGVPHQHVDPYRAMRSGMWPGIMPSGANIRAGVRNAGGRIQRSMPFQTAPLPPPPPPPAPPAAPAAGPVAGFFGAIFGRRRFRHKHHALHPAPSPYAVAETAQTGGCETYGPRADGVKVTVCNGHVTRMEDAQGNVITPNYGPMAGALGFPGFPGMPGFPGHHGHHRMHRMHRRHF